MNLEIVTRWILVCALSLLGSGCGYLVPLAAGAFLGSRKSGSGGVVILIDDEADLVVGRGVADSGSSTEGKGVELVAAQFQLTATKDTTVRELSLRASGTGNDSTVPAVRLHHDLNSDGVLDASDPQLGSTTFSGDDGLATFGGLSLAIAGGKSASLLVVIQTPASAVEGATFQVSIEVGGLKADTLSVTGQVLQTPVFGVPLVSGTKTVSSVGSLQVRLGGNSPLNKTAFANSTDVSVLQLELRASTVEAVKVSAVKFKTSGSGNDLADVVKIGLFVDQDGDGLLNLASDRALATGLSASADDGTITIAGLSETISAGAVVRWLVVYDFAGSAVNDNVFRVDLRSGSDLTAVGVTSAQTLSPAGAPVGNQVRIVGSTAKIALSQASLSTTVLTPGVKDQPALRLVFTETSGLTPVLLESVALTGSGSAQEPSDITSVGLWRDTNQDGAVDGGDTKLGAVSFVVDNGRVVFSGLSETIAPGGQLHVLAALDVGVPPGVVNGESVRLSVAGTTDLSLKESTTQIPVIPSGLPLGGPLTAAGFGLPAVTISQGAAAPTSSLRPTQSDAPVLHLVLTETTSSEAALLSQVKVTASGSGGDDSDVTRARIWRDNGNGTFDGSPTDTVLATATYPSNDGQAVFPLSEVIGAGAAVSYFVTYDLGSVTNVVPGETYAASLSATADVTLKAQTTGFTVTPTGLPQTGATHTAVGPAVTLTLGPGAPASSPLPTRAEVPVLDLQLAEGSGDGSVNLARLVVTGSGTGHEALDLSAVKLWRDANANGAFDGTAGDVLLATAAYGADDGALTFSISEVIPSSGSVRFFVTYDFASSTQLSAGETFRASIVAATDLTLTATAGGFAVTPSAAFPLTGSLQTATLPAITLSQGAGAPPASVAALQSDVPALHLVLTEGANVGSVDFTRLVVTASGSGQDQLDVARVKLWRDANTNGSFDGSPGDVQVGAGGFTSDDGTLAFALSESIPSLGNRAYFVTYDLASSTQVTTGETFRLSVASSGDLTLSATSGGYPITPAGAPQSGQTLTANLPAISLAQGSGAPAASIAPLHSNTPALHLVLSETTGQGAVEFSGLALTASGSGDDATDLTGAKLWRDANANGVFDGAPGDVLIGAGSYGADDGGIAFVVSETISASGSRSYFVTYDFAGSSRVTAGETYRASAAAAGLTLRAAAGGAPVVASGATVVGSLLTAAVPVVNLSLGAGAPGGSVAPGQTSVPVLHLVLAEGTGNGAVDLTRIALTASGSGDDSVDLAAVRLWRDANANGTFDGAAGDILLASGGYTADDGQLVFAVTETIPSSGSRSYFVTYDFASAGLTTGEQFRASVLSSADLTLRGAVNGFVVTPGGLPQSGALKTVNLPAVAIQLAGGAPGGTVNPEQKQVPALSVTFTESTGNGAVDLTRLAVTASGSGEDDLDLSVVQLWRDNGNGTFEGGSTDTLVGSGGYLADDGQVVFSLGETIPSSGSRQYFVVYDLAGADKVTSGQQYRASVNAATDVTLRSAAGAAPITLTGTLPSTGNLLTAAASPIVALSQGVALPASLVRPDEVDRPALQLRLTNSSTAAVGSLTSLTVRGVAGETGNDDLDILFVELWRDVDQDGTVSGGDVKIGVSSFFSDPGRATFVGLDEGIPVSGGTLDLLVTFDMADSAQVNNPAGETYRAQVQAGDVELTAPGGWRVPPSTTLPQTGPQLTAAPPVLAGLAVSQGVAIANTTVSDGEADVEMIQLRVQRTGTGSVQLNTLRVAASGTAPDQTDVQFVKLWRDQGTLGVRDAGDVQIGLSAFFVDNGQASFAISETVGAAPLDLLVTYDLAPAISNGGTFNLSVPSGGISATRVSDGQPATVSGLTQIGPTHQEPPGSQFGAPVSVTLLTNATVQDLVAGVDLNRDGKEDIVALRSANFDVLLGNGAGAFPTINTSGTALTAPTRLEVADMNRDGALDVVVLDGSEVEVYLNSGSGTFLTAPLSLTVVGGTLVDLKLVDYDRDGDQDVVLLNAAAMTLVGLKNDGTGVLSASDSVGLPAGSIPRRLVVGDVDRDGRQDVVLTDDSGSVRLAPGNATFFSFADADGGGVSPQGLVLADLDRDARLDVVVVDAQSNSTFRSHRGQSGPAQFVAGAGPLDTSPVPPLAPADDFKDAWELVSGDWDGDGRTDLAIVHLGVDGISILPGDGTLSFPPGVASGINLEDADNHDRLARGDFNADGDPDLVVGTSTAAVTSVGVSLGDGLTKGGTVGVTTPTTYLWGNEALAVAVGDFDLDGEPDFVTAGKSDALGVWINGGNGATFSNTQNLPLLDEPPSAVAVADLNRDGKPDIIGLVRGGGSDSLQIFHNNGTGTFALASTVAMIDDSDPRAFALGDLDRDGILDAVVAEEGNDSFQIFRGNASGGFDPPLPANRIALADKPVDILLGDHDLDGDLDVIVVLDGAKQVVFYPNTNPATLTFGSPTAFNLNLDGGKPLALAQGDIDQDGRLDLIVTSRNKAAFDILRGDGTGGFSNPLGAFVPAFKFRDVLLADTDKDGDLDLVFSRADGIRSLMIYPLTARATFSLGSPVLRATDTGGDPFGIALADFNRDGDLDLVAAIENDKEAQVFFGN